MISQAYDFDFGSETVSLPTCAWLALIYFFMPCLFLFLSFVAYALFASATVGEAKCVPGVVFFVFGLSMLLLDLPGEAYASGSLRIRWGEL